MKKPSPFIAYFAFIILGMPFGLLNIAWTYIQEDFDLPLSALGVLMTIGTTGHLITAFASGRIIGRAGAGTFLLAGSALGTLGLLGVAVAPGWGLLLITIFIASLGGGVLDAGLNTVISARFAVRHMNWLHACFGIGMTLGPRIVTVTVETLDQSWRWSYAAVMVLQVLLTIMLLVTRHTWTIQADENSNEAGSAQAPARMTETLAVPTVILGFLLFAAYGGAEIGTGQLANTLLVKGRDLDANVASAWISLYWGSFTVVRILIGVAANRVSNQRLLRASMIGSVVGVALLWLHVANFFDMVGLMIMGASFASIFPTLTAETPGRVGLRHAPNAVGVQIGMAGVGGALLPAVATAVAEQTGLEAIALLLLLNVVLFVALYEFMRRRPVQPGKSEYTVGVPGKINI
ncbi:MAG: MFS transporter [Chloroflexi bacterium]|nr:MFS transporter [Chloroflexota bacterium]